MNAAGNVVCEFDAVVTESTGSSSTVYGGATVIAEDAVPLNLGSVVQGHKDETECRVTHVAPVIAVPAEGAIGTAPSISTSMMVGLYDTL